METPSIQEIENVPQYCDRCDNLTKNGGHIIGKDCLCGECAEWFWYCLIEAEAEQNDVE